MLKFGEICKKITKHTKWMLHLEAFVFVALLTAAVVCSIVAQTSQHYYELMAVKADLIAAMRPCVAIAGIGAIAVQWLESS